MIEQTKYHMSLRQAISSELAGLELQAMINGKWRPFTWLNSNEANKDQWQLRLKPHTRNEANKIIDAYFADKGILVWDLDILRWRYTEIDILDYASTEYTHYTSPMRFMIINRNRNNQLWRLA